MFKSLGRHFARRKLADQPPSILLHQPFQRLQIFVDRPLRQCGAALGRPTLLSRIGRQDDELPQALCLVTMPLMVRSAYGCIRVHQRRLFPRKKRVEIDG